MKAIYARQSVDKKDSISIESQIQKCKYEAENSDDNTEEIKIYSDKGFSGKNTERPKFQEMMQDVKNGKISKVIVYKIDRISRAIVDFGRIMEEFEKYKVEFVSYTEKFDTSTPIGRAMLNIIMVFAQLERETIQQRVKDNYYDRGKQGFYLGGKAPYGYNKIETTLQGKKTYTFEENVEQSGIVKMLFQKYADTNISLGGLIKELNNNQMYTNFGNPWSTVSLGRLLHNPVYVMADAEVYSYLKNKGATINNEVNEFIGENGCYLYAERKNISTSKFTDISTSYVTIGLHKGFIQSDVWLKCQDKLDNNKQVKNSGKGTHSWLSGLMKCGYCGLAINVVNNNRGNTYINCGGRKLKSCYGRKKVVHLSDIEEMMDIEIMNYLKKYKEEMTLDNDSNTINNIEINNLKIQQIQIEDKINNLINSLAEGSITINKYINENINQLDNQKNNIQEQIDEIKKQQNHKHKIKSIDIDDAIENWSNYTFDQKKEVANAIIIKITILDDRTEVTWIS